MVISDEHQFFSIIDLPNEIQLQVFEYLDLKTRLIASRVCRLWNALAFTGRLMGEICVHLNLKERNLARTIDVLGSSARRYRHVVINFSNSSFSSVDTLADILSVNDALETLVLTGISRIETDQLFKLLENVPNLVRMFLLGDAVDEYSKMNLLELPKCHVTGIPVGAHPRWIETFPVDSSVVLRSLDNLCLLSPTLSSSDGLQCIPYICPNIRRLQITGTDASVAAMFEHFHNKLEKISIISPQRDFFLQFCNINFPKLSSLYVDRMELHDQESVTSGIAFFTERCTNLERLVLHPKFMIRTPIFTTICTNCVALQKLELSLDYLDGDALKNVTNLQNLKALTFQGTAYFRETARWPYQIGSLVAVKIAGSRFPLTLLEFIADIAPNLNALALEDVENPEEMFRILPSMVGHIRHLELGYSARFERPPSCHPSGLLRSLDNLETYSLRRVIIKHGIQGWLQDAPHLKWVLLASCATLTDTHLVILTTNCPKLRQLTIRDCCSITQKGIDEFKMRIPLCRISGDWQ
ncbi:uncharacterized protein LOC128737774 [Sabethes cyaneus]|uniref:uncharacterized protein LOC128737774 n=1 Tax=Sabethes cyaneus TaxID=53552 RepID=UPI00237DA285|nr:uncharacterized protein LOC128737774 [Sabethes cyaneus]